MSDTKQPIKTVTKELGPTGALGRGTNLGRPIHHSDVSGQATSYHGDKSMTDGPFTNSSFSG